MSDPREQSASSDPLSTSRPTNNAIPPELLGPQPRLSAEEKAQILAELPPEEERERLYRELIEQGGMSGEEFLALLEEPKP